MQRKLFLVMFLGVLIGSAGAFFLFPSIARADTCAGFVFHTNVAANETSGTHYGGGVDNPGMTIFNHGVGCIEVSSILNENVSGDNAEIGWVQIAVGVYDCNATGDGTPRVLTAYITASTFHCFQHAHLTDYGQADSFYIWNDNGSGGSFPWTWEHNGLHPQTANLDFRLGIDVTNGERLSTYDSAQSEFHGLLVGHDVSWNDWAGAVCDSDNDPSYSNKILSSTQVNVSTAGTPC